MNYETGRTNYFRFQSGKITECTLCPWGQGVAQNLLRIFNNSFCIYNYILDIKGFQKYEMNPMIF